MRKTSIEKVIDRQPCTNAEAQTFCGNAWNALINALGGIKGNRTEHNNAAQ
jgi:hypothetical protein